MIKYFLGSDKRAGTKSKSPAAGQLAGNPCFCPIIPSDCARSQHSQTEENNEHQVFSPRLSPRDEINRYLIFRPIKRSIKLWIFLSDNGSGDITAY